MSKRLLLTIAAMMLVGLTYAQYGIDFEKSKYGRNPKAGHYVNIRGFKMYYETYGKGDPLLMMHGNGGSINDFTYQIPYFAKDYQVIVADNRAHGKSIDMSDSLSYEMMADDFNALLDALHLDSCYIIGWSDGGINGLLLAMRHPKKVKKLAVTGATLRPDTTAIEVFVYKNTFEQRDALTKLPVTAKTKNALKLVNLLAEEPNISVEQLRYIQCPTLVIGDDHDVALAQHTLSIAAAIPKSYLWILPNSGHSTPLFYKELFNRTVADFFKQPYRKIQGFGHFD